MVNIERPRGAEDGETSLMEEKQTAERNKKVNKSLWWSTVEIKPF